MKEKDRVYCFRIKNCLCLCGLYGELYAFCRCISGQAIVYTGDTCEKQHIDGGILGVLIGGAAGIIALTAAIIAVIYRQN